MSFSQNVPAQKTAGALSESLWVLTETQGEGFGLTLAPYSVIHGKWVSQNTMRILLRRVLYSCRSPRKHAVC